MPKEPFTIRTHPHERDHFVRPVASPTRAGRRLRHRRGGHQAHRRWQHPSPRLPRCVLPIFVLDGFAATAAPSSACIAATSMEWATGLGVMVMRPAGCSSAAGDTRADAPRALTAPRRCARGALGSEGGDAWRRSSPCRTSARRRVRRVAHLGWTRLTIWVAAEGVVVPLPGLPDSRRLELA